MEHRSNATSEDVSEIASLVRRGEPVAHLVSRVILSEAQRDIIRKAHVDQTSFRVYEMPEKIVYSSDSSAHCLRGGAPGLVQQRIRR